MASRFDKAKSVANAVRGAVPGGKGDEASGFKKRKAKYPNAKTFTDGKGVVRAIGGKVVKTPGVRASGTGPAPRPVGSGSTRPKPASGFKPFGGKPRPGLAGGKGDEGPMFKKRRK